MSVLRITSSLLEVAGVVAGVTGVAGSEAGIAALHGIVKACENIAIYREKSKSLANHCAVVLNEFNDHRGELDGSQLQSSVDEVTAVLETIRRKTVKWARYGKVEAFIKQNKISEGLDKCRNELDLCLNRFNASAHILNNFELRNAEAQKKRDHDELQRLLCQILENQKGEMSNVVELQNQGTNAGQIIMEAGQRELSHLRQNFQAAAVPDSRYVNYEKSLATLHHLTGVPPTVKVLDGEIKRNGTIPIAGGTYSDIWMGTWLNDEKVALKSLRNIRGSDLVMQKRFEKEICVWSKLTNDHILSFYGIVTNIGHYIHVVSPWLENGNVLDYSKAHPEADKIHLLFGASEGLSYLHKNNVVHGNVKCANILVSAEGEAKICDFGMSRVMEEVTNISASATLTSSGGSTRWLAPELIEGSKPTLACDIYSFGMAALELQTGRLPYSHLKRDAQVVRAISVDKILPHRAGNDNVDDEMWSLMEQCWQRKAEARPGMEEIRKRILEIDNKGKAQ